MSNDCINGKMMRIAVISDIHGNLLALNAFLNAVENEGIDYIYHLGDAIYLCPYSYECLTILFQNPKVRMVRGNYEEYLILGENHPQRMFWKSEFIEHQRQANEFITLELKKMVSQIPYIIREHCLGKQLCFLHYPFDSKKNYYDIISNPQIEDLNNLFKNYSDDIIFYGHEHSESDLQGNSRYVNPGSLGCSKDDYAKYIIINFDYNGYQIEHKKVKYDRDALFRAFEEKKTIGKDAIIKNYFM
ncbi:MAG: YfcE family phosphodiesterase [Anaerocolumna sp.]|jgi:predicted phosphodiesterase|nr:YfcE family phosphodiesterase [Anaerocolumna sp.]